MLLTAADIRRALIRLGELAEAQGETVELALAGGAVMALKYGARETTRDVDALFLNPAPAAVRALARRVADELGLEPDWLNDGVKGFLGAGPDLSDVLLESPGIHVRSVSVEQMLGMKLAAFRDAVDREDALVLLRDLPGPKEAIWNSVEPFVQPPAQSTKAWYAFDELWQEVHGED